MTARRSSVTVAAQAKGEIMSSPGSARSRWVAVPLVMLAVALAPSAAASKPTGPPRTTIGRAAVVAGTFVQTVLAAEQWHGGTLWKPAPGTIGVVVQVRLRALKPVLVRAADYRLRDAQGKLFAPRAASRRPAFSSVYLRRGQRAQGWLTFSVPTSRIRSLVLVYRPSAPGLLVSLGTPRVLQGRVGAAFSVSGEHSLTVLGAERWQERGASADRLLVGVSVRVTARLVTPVGKFSLMDAAGNHYEPATVLRQPQLGWNAPLRAGASLEGWVAFSVPTSQAGSLTLCYHAHDFAGPSVLVALGAVPERPQKPLSEARLAGRFDVTLTVTAVSGFSVDVGKTEKVTFTLTPQCSTGACDVQLAFPAAGWLAPTTSTVTVPLANAGGTYGGSASASLSTCHVLPATGTVEIHLQASSGGWIGEEWSATGITGTFRYSTPYIDRGLWYCNPASMDESVTGTLAG